MFRFITNKLSYTEETNHNHISESLKRASNGTVDTVINNKEIIPLQTDMWTDRQKEKPKRASDVTVTDPQTNMKIDRQLEDANLKT